MSCFENKTTMPADPSKDVVRTALAEPMNECCAQVPGLHKWDNHTVHAPSPSIGKKV